MYATTTNHIANIHWKSISRHYTIRMTFRQPEPDHLDIADIARNNNIQYFFFEFRCSPRKMYSTINYYYYKKNIKNCQCEWRVPSVNGRNISGRRITIVIIILFCFPVGRGADGDKGASGRSSSGGNNRRHRRREIAIPIARQTRHTVLRVAEGHPGPGVVGPLPGVLRRVRRRLLDIVHHRVRQAEIVDGHLKERCCVGGRTRAGHRQNPPRAVAVVVS